MRPVWTCSFGDACRPTKAREESSELDTHTRELVNRVGQGESGKNRKPSSEP